MIPEHDHNNYNCEIQTDNGDRRRVYANWLHNNNLDHWQGWYCEAGLSNFHVDKNFNIDESKVLEFLKERTEFSNNFTYNKRSKKIIKAIIIVHVS